MMKRILVVFCFLMSFSVMGQVPEFEWAKQMGGSDGQYGKAITTDKSGNVYVTGNFSDTTDFDPGPSTFNLVSILDVDGYHSTDVFVAKYDSEGQFLWAVSFGEDESDRGHSIATDTFNNVYITGTFDGGVDFDPGPDYYNIYGSNAGFILKLDTNGSFVWAGKLDTYLDSEFAIDESGFLYITGRYNGTLDCDLGPGVYNVTGIGAFVLKLDQDGNFLWVKTLESDDYAKGGTITLDSMGNIYATGEFNGVTDFDPGADEFILTEVGPTGRDIFILKLDSEGNFIWVKQISSLDADHFYWPHPYGIVVDSNTESVFVTGTFDETCDFDPGPDTFNLVSHVLSDFFILKLDVDGNFVWVKTGGGESLDLGGGIQIDNSSNLYVVGGFHGTVDFNPGNDTFNLSSPSLDIHNTFILKLDADGNYIWAGSFYGSGRNDSGSIALDKWSNIYTTGFFSTADFDPDTSVYNLTGSLDVFIHKMIQPCNANPSINTSNNNFTICAGDSIILNAYLPSFIEEVSYSWSTSDTLDFITISPDTTTSFAVSVSYTFNDMLCTLTDAVEVAVLEKPDTTYLGLATCDSLTAGITTFIYPTQNGCDSIVVETTALIPIPAMPVAPADLTILEDEPPFQVLVPEVPNATEYIWTVPTGAQIISGAGTTNIIVDWNYDLLNDSICVQAVNDCGSSPVACISIIVDVTDAVEEVGGNKESDVVIFPNPVDETLQVFFKNADHRKLQLISAHGKVVLQHDYFNEQISINTAHLPAGVYSLGIQQVAHKYNYWRKIIVQR